MAHTYPLASYSAPNGSSSQWEHCRLLLCPGSCPDLRTGRIFYGPFSKEVSMCPQINYLWTATLITWSFGVSHYPMKPNKGTKGFKDEHKIFSIMTSWTQILALLLLSKDNRLSLKTISRSIISTTHTLTHTHSYILNWLLFVISELGLITAVSQVCKVVREQLWAQNGSGPQGQLNWWYLGDCLIWIS